MTNGLIIPAMTLVLIAWLVPKFLSMVFPEGVRPLMLLALMASMILFLISAGFFFFLYLSQGITLEDMAAFGWLSNAAFFGQLGMISALLWAPVMILSVAGIPRTWTKETW